MRIVLGLFGMISIIEAVQNLRNSKWTRATGWHSELDLTHRAHGGIQFENPKSQRAAGMNDDS